MNRIYLIGNGYVCDFITKEPHPSYEFIGVCRSKKNNCDRNISIDISKDNEDLGSLIKDKSIVVYLAPPQQGGIRDLTLENFLLNINKQNIKKIIYISTSGVYGDKNDQVVNENAAVCPITDRAKRRVDAELQIKKSSLTYTILRVPGIYGKGRLPLKRIYDKTPLIKKNICKHTNLINVNDLVRIIINCFNNNRTSGVTMNVSDGSPIKTTEYYLHIYDFLKLAYPEFINYEKANKLYDNKRKSFINESRILDITLMNQLLPNIIRFKDVREGIKNSLV